MFVLHGSIEKEKFLIWAEKSVLGQIRLKTRGRKPINPKPKIHPFAMDRQELSNALGQLKIEKDSFIRSLVWLPSGDFPSISNSILGSPPERKQSFSILPWTIWSYELTFDQLFHLLLLAKDKDILFPKVLLGKEFSFYINLFHFVISLVLRQRYLPNLSKIDDDFFTPAWSAVFIGKDKERFNILKKAMPSVCCSLTTSLKRKEPPSISINETLMRFINKFIDFIVKKAQTSLPSLTDFNTTHDNWLSGLISEGKKLDIKENKKLAYSIDEWQQSLKNIVSSPFKLCFKIEEPEETKEIKDHLHVANSDWKVSYLLQAYDDPSLIVSTQEIWNPKGMKRKILQRDNFNVRQFILSSLGFATGLCPHVESSLSEPIPKGFDLSSNSAFSFFNDYASKLEDAGFGLICPNWWKKDLYVKAFINSPFRAVRNRSIWDDLQTDWRVFLNDLNLSKEELYQLSLLKAPIIKMKGHWVILNKKDISKAINFLEKKPYKVQNALDLLQISAGVSKKQHGISIKGVETSGWAAEFLESIQQNSLMKIPKIPKNFKGTLRKYQMRGYAWMSFLQKWQIGACLADDMGLGKTPQTLALVMSKWEDSKSSKPSLLICPTSLIGNWDREVLKFVPKLPIYIHHGSNRKTNDKFLQQCSEVGLVITSYALVWRDKDLFEKIHFDGIILDEAQNIKNSEAKQTQAIYELKSNYKLALTGTPVENNIGDLWSLMNFLNPGYLGTKESFRELFFNPIQIEKDPKSSNSLKQLIKPLILRRVKTDRSIISDLPKKIEMKTYCQLKQEQITLYETVVADANGLLDKVEGIKRRGIILATLVKLKQICNHPAIFLNDKINIQNRSGKLTRLIEMLEEIYAVDERCLIFTQYTQMGDLLKNYIEEKYGKEVLFLHGAVRKKQRDFMIDRFQNEENGPNVFILSLKAGGVGLNLTRANHVFHFDRWWNPAVENQATDRVFRIGQKKNVQVYKFICNGTIEERIDEMIESKKQIAKSVIGSGEKWLTELSTESLKELWKLRKSTL